MKDAVTHRELAAKLEALEARMDGRIGRIEDSVRVISESVQGLRADQREMRIEMRTEMQGMRAEMQGMRTEMRTEVHAMDQKISNLKSTIVTTAFVSVIALVLGISSFNATLVSNMMSIFQLATQPQAKSQDPLNGPVGLLRPNLDPK